MVSLNLFLIFFFFSRQKFLIKDQFEFGLNPHEVLQFFQTLFKNQNSRFRPSGRHFISWNHIMFLCCEKNAESFQKFQPIIMFLALWQSFWPHEGVRSTFWAKVHVGTVLKYCPSAMILLAWQLQLVVIKYLHLIGLILMPSVKKLVSLWKSGQYQNHWLI